MHLTACEYRVSHVPVIKNLRNSHFCCDLLLPVSDPASTGNESMYAMMKSVPGGNMSAVIFCVTVKSDCISTNIMTFRDKLNVYVKIGVDWNQIL